MRVCTGLRALVIKPVSPPELDRSNFNSIVRCTALADTVGYSILASAERPEEAIVLECDTGSASGIKRSHPLTTN